MVITVIGARPQFIKAAVVSKALADLGIIEKIIHTGQHFDDKMSQIFWDELDIPKPAINLNVGPGRHGQQTALMIEKIESYLLENRKNIRCVLLYGDTNSTLAGAIAASKLELKIIHIEAGLRSFNRNMPEEVNRIATDHLSDILLCPSAISVKQLEREGLGDRQIYDVGDVMYDAMLTFTEHAAKTIDINKLLPFKNKEFSLLTMHRPSNVDVLSNLANIIDALGNIDIPFLWPVHPRVKSVVNLNLPSNIYPVPPVSYLEMLCLLTKCFKVVTDSGGLQKEAYWMKKPCITLRNETEWVETLDGSWNCLAGNDKDKIVQSFERKTYGTWIPLYGKGATAKLIANIIFGIEGRTL